MGRVPVTETIFRPFHLGLTLLVVVVWTVLAALLHPRPEDTVEADPALFAEVTPEAVTPRRPPRRVGMCGASSCSFPSMAASLAS